MTNTLIRLTTVPDEQDDREIPILVPISSIHFIHSAIPAAPEGKAGPQVDCTGVYMMHNGKPLFVKETLEQIAAMTAIGYPA